MRKNRRSPLDVERLDTRELMTAGVTAQLSHGVLTVTGSSPSAPIVIDVLATANRRGVSGVVVVEGVGMFPASGVHKVIIGEVAGERVAIRRGASWNPTFQVNPPRPAPPLVKPTPIPKPTPTPTPTPTPAPTSPIVGSTTETAEELAIVSAVNAARAQNGLAPLTVNPKLVEAAHIQAHDMATLDVMAHDLPGAALPGLIDRANYVGYTFRTMGENIAFNYPDVASVMNGWMNSPEHRANILDPSYTEIRVGVALDSAGEPYYCQVFGQPA